MKILIAGDWHSDLHEEPVFQAFKELGHDCHRFSWHQYFNSFINQSFLNLFYFVSSKFQNKFNFGARIIKLNDDLVVRANEIKPDLLFIYRGIQITRKTIISIKNSNPGIIIVGYNNDDPFSREYQWWVWRHFLKAVPEYDLVLAYRLHNIGEFIAIKAKKVDLLRSWFVPWRSFPAHLSTEDRDQFECDVVFVGHYEPDGRLELLESIVRNGFRLRLFGPDWFPIIKKSKILKHLAPIKILQGEDYNKALSGAKIGLCFLSKLNRDTYTRRCFEIPASGTLLLSEYSKDLSSLYSEGVDADFFRNERELIFKLRKYLNDDSLRKKVAHAGYVRVHTDGHDVRTRMLHVLSIISPLLNK